MANLKDRLQKVRRESPGHLSIRINPYFLSVGCSLFSQECLLKFVVRERPSLCGSHGQHRLTLLVVMPCSVGPSVGYESSVKGRTIP